MLNKKIVSCSDDIKCASRFIEVNSAHKKGFVFGCVVFPLAHLSCLCHRNEDRAFGEQQSFCLFFKGIADLDECWILFL